MALQVESNVKIIKSGNIPIAWNGTTGLKEGEMAFGLITADNKYHLYGNSQGTVVDLVEASQSELQALDSVLTQGNESNKSIVLKDATESTTTTLTGYYVETKLDDTHNSHMDDGGVHVTSGLETAVVSSSSVSLTKEEESSSKKVSMSLTNGFSDNNKPVLSANPDRTIADADKTTMRNAINVYAKTEVYTKGETDSAIDTKLSSVFKFKGTVDAVADLPTDAATGDTCQVTADGKLYAWDGDEWHNLSFVVDLSKYYTSEQIDVSLAAINTTIEGHTTQIGTLTTDVTDLKTRMTTAEGKITALETGAASKQDKFATLTKTGDTLQGITLDSSSDSIFRISAATGNKMSFSASGIDLGAGSGKVSVIAKTGEPDGTARLSDVSAPEANTDAANKKYVDDAVADISVELIVAEI